MRKIPPRPVELRSFGRRRTNRLSNRQDQLLIEGLARIRFNLSDLPIGPSGRPVWLEIGFGGGEHLAVQALHNPDKLFIGAEPFVDGVAKLLAEIDARGLDNVRIHENDVRPMLRALPGRCIDRCFILFPDPWPKRRHAKRRLISPAFVAELARIMKPGSELRIATDIADYARTLLLAILDEDSFTWPARTADDWRLRPEDWVETRYEKKAQREGRPISYFQFVRNKNGR